MLTAFVFSIVVLAWLSTAVLSKKRFAGIKEKDGTLGVALAITAFGWLLSLLCVIGALIYNNSGSGYHFELLDAMSIFFFVMTGALALEILVFYAIKKTESKSQKHS